MPDHAVAYYLQGGYRMSEYFSFRKFITSSFVKFIYVPGFLLLTGAGVALIVWASLRLRDATIPTRLGYYYIAAGAAVVLLGNLLWRVLCELWVVLFNMNGLLASINARLTPQTTGGSEPVVLSSEPARQEAMHQSFGPRQTSVLGLSG